MTKALLQKSSRWLLWVSGCKTPRSGEMFIERRIPLNFIANLKGLAVL